MSADWPPTATREVLRKRAEALGQVRAFFASRSVMEVDTPVIVNAPVSDVHIHSAEVRFPDDPTARSAPGAAGVVGAPGAPDAAGASAAPKEPPPARFFLHTSPEFAMKRLLAAGSGDIYQICHVARGLERGRHHNPEFTLIEWYRHGFSLEQLMDEVEALARAVLGPAARGFASERVTYRDAFLRELGIDPLSCDQSAIEHAARDLGFQHAGGTSAGATSAGATSASEPGDAGPNRANESRAPAHTSLAEPTSASADPARDELLDFLMAAHIGPRLGRNALTFIHRYPASQAALARLDPSDARCALRFELYCEGIELANGFHELASAAEQRERFEQDLAERARRGLPVHSYDERLLAALAHGLPDCAGVALGFDRLLMLASGARHIEDVLPFTTDRA